MIWLKIKEQRYREEEELWVRVGILHRMREILTEKVRDRACDFLEKSDQAKEAAWAKALG